jgi:hypothetical protein
MTGHHGRCAGPGSSEGIAVAPAGKQIVLDVREDLGRRFNASTVALKSKTSK